MAEVEISIQFLHAEILLHFSLDYPRELILSGTSTGVSSKKDLEDSAVQQMLSLCGKLIQQGVGFVGCQKCIHPAVRDYLKIKVRVLLLQLCLFLTKQHAGYDSLTAMHN